MKWKFDHSRIPVYFRVDVEGSVSADEMAAFWSELIAHPEWRPGTSILIDNNHLEPLGPGAPEIIKRSTSFFIENQSAIGPSCIAIVRTTAEIYLYSRQFEYALRLRGSSVVVRNFGDEGAAIEWLTDHASINGLSLSSKIEKKI